MHQDENYCHNCRYWGPLRDGVHCGYCIDFFYANGHLPRKGE